MIVVYHKNNRISRVESIEKKAINFNRKKSVAYGLMQLAIQFPESKLVWCHESYQEQINLDTIPELMHHNKLMLSYYPNTSDYLGKRIGYIEDSPFITVNKKVTYPTWQMSSWAGVIHASVLLTFKNKIKIDPNFDYYLNSIAKVGMPLGLFCYSEPALLQQEAIGTTIPTASAFTIFKFVKQHYKTRWVFLLLVNLIIYEFRLPFLAFIYALFFKNKNSLEISLDSIPVQSNRPVVQNATIDVIIPTIGRKKYLYDVLKDLSQQTHLPVNVIIVEQNPLENSVSDLDYLQNETWPFVIKHTFTHQAGACNARNLALSQIESEWVFMADDDIRFDADFLKNALENNNKFGVTAVLYSCLLKNQVNTFLNISQTTIFGSGCSMVKKANLSGMEFDKSLEFGYGEDTDFGLQLRNLGVDIIYLPEPTILHLKAPIGGFRIKPTFPWSAETIQPKPSPSIMYLKLKHSTEEQLLGYKLVFFLKMLNGKSILKLGSLVSSFNKKWDRSLYWAKKLNGYD